MLTTAAGGASRTPSSLSPHVAPRAVCGQSLENILQLASPGRQFPFVADLER